MREDIPNLNDILERCAAGPQDEPPANVQEQQQQQLLLLPAACKAICSNISNNIFQRCINSIGRYVYALLASRLTQLLNPQQRPSAKAPARMRRAA
jgi:hypothetical protein